MKTAEGSEDEIKGRLSLLNGGFLFWVYYCASDFPIFDSAPAAAGEEKQALAKLILVNRLKRKSNFDSCRQAVKAKGRPLKLV